MSDYKFNPDEVVGVTASNVFRFNKESGEVLRLDERGFHYKGQTIDDAGEAYRLFMNWMKNTQEQE